MFSNFYLGFPMILNILAALGSGGPPELQNILENWKNLNKNWKKWKIIRNIGKTLVFPIFSNFYLGFPMILSILAALGSPRPPHPCRPHSPPLFRWLSFWLARLLSPSLSLSLSLSHTLSRLLPFSPGEAGGV